MQGKIKNKNLEERNRGEKKIKGDRKEPGTGVRPSKAVQTRQSSAAAVRARGRNPQHKVSCPPCCLPYHCPPEPAR